MNPDSIIDHASLAVLAGDRGLANISRTLSSVLGDYCKRHGLSVDAMAWEARIAGRTVQVAIGAENRWLTHTFRSRGEKGVRTRWQHKK